MYKKLILLFIYLIFSDAFIANLLISKNSKKNLLTPINSVSYNNTHDFTNVYLSKLSVNNAEKNEHKIVIDKYNYLNSLNHIYELSIINKIKKRQNIIKKINFDDFLMLNNYIDVIYYKNSLSDKIILEFKNNTKVVYYFNNDFKNIMEIVKLNKNIEKINLNSYPNYILNTPFGFLLCEEN